MSLETDDGNRPLAIFSPSVWGDHFMKNASHSMEIDSTEEAINKLKNEVRKMFEDDAAKTISQMLELVDAVQRLGLASHFENEIDETLKKMHDDDAIYEDLETVALRFRLLRQQGYNVPCHVFMKFKDEEGRFNESLQDDIRGMLSLYEASHLRCHGEEILDESLIFTTTHLKSIGPKLSSQMSEQVNHALKHPIRKSMERREARRYITAYEQDNSHKAALLILAKLDFNQMQLLYQKELSEFTRWLKVDVESGTDLLSFGRDRAVQCFYWSLAIYYEAKYSFSRLKMAKMVAMLTLIDDMFDSFGTLPELENFADAIERWDLSATTQLPEYMKLLYKAILEFYSWVADNIAVDRRYCIEYSKKALFRAIRSYLHEAKWFHNKELPSFDEYLPMGCLNACSSAMTSMTLIGMANEVTKETMDWVLSDPEPKLVNGLSLVGRLMNDMASPKSEYRKSKCVVASAVVCYMKQYGATEEETMSELTARVASAWKDVNEECLKPPIPRRLAMRVLDVVRASDEIYRDGDGFTEEVILNEAVNSLIINPFPV